MEVNAVQDGSNTVRPDAARLETAGEVHGSQDLLSTATINKVTSPLSLHDVLKTEEARQLDALLASKKDSAILLALEPADNTQRFMRACLRGSYLFGREVVPNYLANVFKSLTGQTPVSDEVGHVVRGLIGMCVGELATNNIFRRDGECHAHFHDLYEAYVEAGGSLEEVQRFISSANQLGTLAAIKDDSSLWSKGAKEYAEKLIAVCNDPLASFILMPCNEILSTVIYPVALTHMSAEPRFDKFRQFMSVHVQLDGDDHGAVALDWLAMYLRTSKASPEDISVATKKVMALYSNERA
jgi:hypothetical protein